MNPYLKNKKIKRFSQEIEPHEVFLDQLAQEKEKEFGISEKKIETPLSQRILQGVFLIFFIFLLFIFGKTFQLQVLEREKYQALAENNKFILETIRAERGVIYDQNLNQLVFNRPAFNLICQKSELSVSEEEKLKIIKEISKLINQDFKKLSQKIKDSKENTLLILENIPQPTLVLLETRIEEFPGFKIENNTRREYLDGPSFVHLLGYTGKITSSELKENPQFYSLEDWVGRAGIEKSYEEVLRKIPGKLQIERDALGRQISKEITSQPESGESLILWLDANLQKKIEEELKIALKNLGGTAAAAVALDPKTGGVLALVSLPTLDNNLLSQARSDPEALNYLLEDPQDRRPFFNRAISGLGYLVGSTIKPLIGIAALEEGIITPGTTINCQGKIQVQDQWHPEVWHEYDDWKTHGVVDIYKAIAESCNVFFYTIGGGYQGFEGLRPTKIKNWLEKFSWGSLTGIDLPEEGKGFIPDPQWKKRVLGETWHDGNTYHLSIGQGYITITPLQVATAFSAIANGGKLLKPEVVQKIVDTSTGSIEVLQEIKPEILKENFIDPQNLEVVRRGMREAVIYGSSATLNTLPVKAASKTGTAQSSEEDLYHHWVTVFAPYDDPQIVLTIIIENLKGVQFAALPVAKNVLEWYFSQ